MTSSSSVSAPTAAKPVRPAELKTHLEPIRAEHLASMTPESRLIACSRAARWASSAGLAWELGRELSPIQLLERPWDRNHYGSSHEQLSPLEAALHAGQLPLARGFAGRARTSLRDKSAQSFRSWHSLSTSWTDWMRRAQGSSVSDEQLWRARSWLGATHEALSKRKLDVSEIEREARLAFRAARPKLGLWLCELLLSQTPAELFQASEAGAREWPAALSPDFWASSNRSASQARSKIGDALSRRSSERAADPADVPALSLALYWSEQLQSDQPELSASLKRMARQLWKQGSRAHPKDHAALFAEHPYGADDPRALRAVKAGIEMAQTDVGWRGDESLLWHDIFTRLWASSCQHPDGSGPEGSLSAWRSFQNAHAGAPQASGSIFSAHGGLSSAALSLSAQGSDQGRLVEAALDQGDAIESAWALAHPPLIQHLISADRLPEAKLVSQGVVIEARGFQIEGLHMVSAEELAKLGVVKASSASPKSKSPKEGKAPSPKKKAFTERAQELLEAARWVSLPTLALLSGRSELALRLSQACQISPEMSAIRSMLSAAHQDKLDKAMALHETLELRALVADSSIASKRSKLLRV